MKSLGLILAGVPILLLAYAYVFYPALLRLVAAVRMREPVVGAGGVDDWPTVSVSLPAFNEEAVIKGTLDALLALDYPSDRLQIVVVSDASTDGTDAIVRSFRDRGVELVRLEKRSGKTAAEAEVAPHLKGEIVVNTDASVRVRPESMKPLVAAFSDPTVGVASGRDVSVGWAKEGDSSGEATYVGYEMWVRELETLVESIVGASGCFYAIRRRLHTVGLPVHLSRDFAAALIAREHGYRSVSVARAVCEVPRSGSLRTEFRRKVRTMERGLETLWFNRTLLDPFRYGLFSWMLFSHKLCRWLVPLTLPVGLAGLVLVAASYHALAAVAVVVAVVGGTVMAWRLSVSESRFGRLLSLPAFVTTTMLAGIVAWWKALRGEALHIWEPTRRGSDARAGASPSRGKRTAP